MQNQSKMEYLEHMRAEQVRITYQQLPGILGASIAATVLLVLVMHSQVDRTLLIGWIVVTLTIFCGLTSFLFWRYHRAPIVRRRAPIWGTRMALVALASGICWGVAGYLFFPSQAAPYQMFLLMYMFTGAAATMVIMVANRLAFYLSAFAMIAPIALRLAQVGDLVYYALTATCIVYMASLVYFHSHIHASLLSSLRLRFENLDLVNQLQAQKDELEQANQEKVRFLAAASHDLRQPLHAQSLFVGALRRRAVDPENKSILDKLSASMEAMHELLNGLLDISKLDSGITQVSTTRFPIQKLLDELETEFRNMAIERGLKLKLVPSTAIVQSDPFLLGRVLRNFISNALRYTSSGSVLVGCRRRHSGAQLCIEVRDSGPGIPNDQKKAIFQEFFQLANPERDRIKGLGLGLAIVKRIARLLGHAVDVRSRPGAGSTFSIDVPLEGSAEPDQNTVSVNVEHNIKLDGKYVVVIEDDADVRSGMKELLTSWGCNVLVAAAAEDALRQLSSDALQPDIIIADYRLRAGQTGTAAIEMLRQHFHIAIPSVLITGDTAPDRLQEANAAGYPLLHKPVQADELHASLCALVEST